MLEQRIRKFSKELELLCGDALNKVKRYPGGRLSFFKEGVINGSFKRFPF